MTEELYVNCNTLKEKYEHTFLLFEIQFSRLMKAKKKRDAWIAISISLSGLLSPLMFIKSVWFGIPLAIVGYYGIKKSKKHSSDEKSLRYILNLILKDRENFRQELMRLENTQRGTFKYCKTVSDVKKVYREKAKKHHPDRGGDPEKFQLLNVQYQRAINLAQRQNA